MTGDGLTEDTSRELALLRARAYGPDADIGADTGAVARLTELERAAALMRAPRTVADEADAAAAPASASAPVPTSASAPVPGASPVPGPAVVSGSVAPDPPPASPRRARHWWRRRVSVTRGAAAAVAAALCAASAGIAWAAVTAPGWSASRPVTRLPLGTQADVAPALRNQTDAVFRSWGADVTTVQTSKRFGQALAWVARTRSGAVCLILTIGTPTQIPTGDFGMIAGGCAPPGQEPGVDLWSADDSTARMLPSSVGAHSWVRFSPRGDSVRVWVTSATVPS